MTTVTSFRYALGFFALLAALGCGDTSGPGPGPDPNTPAPVSSIQIGSLPQRIEIGDKLKLTAVALDSKGNVLTGRQVSWSVAEPEVASVTDDGTVVFRRRGPVTFTATSEGKTASVTVSVNPITWVALSLSYARSCGVSLAGTLYCWGDRWPEANIPSSNRPLPVLATANMKLKDVLAGSYHICVLDVEDKVFCWGRNDYGELAFAGVSTDLAVPTVVPTQLTFKAFAQSSNSTHTCAQTPSNQIACWGRRPGITVVATPTLVDNGAPLRAHATDGEDECFLRQDARVYCWGSTGPVGFEPGVFREAPTSLAFSEPVVDLAEHCLLAQSGQPWCWTHHVGQGEYSPFLVYSSVALVSFAKGGTSLCALTSDGAPYCRAWLSGSESASFVRVGDLRFRSLSASVTHACGTAVDGALYCWGSNRWGEGGNGTFVDSKIPFGVRDPIIP